MPADFRKARETLDLFALEVELENAVFFLLFQQLIPGLLGKGGKILDRTGVGSLHAKHLGS